MASSRLKEIYIELQTLKDNISKLGPVRRSEQIGKKKYSEAEKLYKEYWTIIEEEALSFELEAKELDESQNIQILSEQIETIYGKILKYSRQNTNMAKFELKTAVSLIPVMDGTEDTTKRIIDSIDLYSTMIEATEHTALINFILKTRLSESAKLRLESSYVSCKNLITDMKTHLLTKKSSTALHSQLVNSSQGSRTIEEYGKTLEELFVQLTVSQADGNTSAYSVLKPLNEKLAVQRFTDGLRNKNLSLILAARNYETIKDVIRAAKDEELSSTRGETRETMFHARRGGRGFGIRGRYVNNQQTRGGTLHRGNYSGYSNQPRFNNNQFGQNWRGHYTRSGNFGGRRPYFGQTNSGRHYNRPYGSSFRGHNTFHNIRFMDNQNQGTVNHNNTQMVPNRDISACQFFRV